MIKAVIFDMGGVLVDIAPFMAQVSNVFEPEDEEEFWERINVDANSLCKGEITLLQFWRNAAQKFGKDIPDYLLKDLWTIDGEPSLHEGMPNIIHSLKNHYKLGILSNTMKEHKIEKKGIFELFDAIILSYEVGLTKEDKDIFLLAAEQLGVHPEECIFIDDVLKFVEVAKSVGMHGILFENAEKLRSDLQTCGVLV